jgi:exopolyphosphatase/guanosine-5'-triphosphate,3'-diphosphate pyrophosphatase
MRIAAIDVGTNSIHMIVCRLRPDRSFEVTDREQDMIRLGTSALDGRALPEASMAAALQTLSRFRRLADSHGVDEIIATATSAVRETPNGGDFVAAVQRDVGIRVRVISGTEEARLIHLAAAYAVNVGRRPVVVLDIGGGSTEVTLGTAFRLQASRSFKLGALRLTERFVRSDPLSGRDERRLERHIRRETATFVRQIKRRGFDRVIGTSGTILSLGTLASRSPRQADDHLRNVRVAAKDISRLRARLTAMPLEDRLTMPGLDPRRADLAVAGAVILDPLLDQLGADELTLCDFALREGLVLDYIQRNAAHIQKVDRYPDVRRRSVIELGERCNYLPAHAQQVARLALMLFDATRSRHKLGPREREWLEYGALLHDIGVHIGYERHHRHSYYLVKHGGLRGFDPDEIEIIALVARYHRQGTPKKVHDGFGSLPRPARAIVRLLGAFVRLAEGLDRSHAQVVTRVDVREGDDGLRIRLHAKGDPELETWAADRHASALAALFGTTILFELAGTARAAAAHKDPTKHADHARHSPHVSRPAIRRRGHRRVGQDHPTRPARQVAHGKGASGLRH